MLVYVGSCLIIVLIKFQPTVSEVLGIVRVLCVNSAYIVRKIHEKYDKKNTVRKSPSMHGHKWRLMSISILRSFDCSRLVFLHWGFREDNPEC